MILAGDIGGTNTRLALCDERRGAVWIRVEEILPSREWPSLEASLGEFLTRHPAEITSASFGIAGPVRDGRSEATNLPWVVVAASVAKQLGLERVGLINDLVANAYGIPLLDSRDLVTLAPGAPGATGNRALIAAGTGLGEAGMVWDGTTHRPVATEAGHVDFAPRTRREMELLDHLIARYGRVSVERVVSGPGLVNVYRFLRDVRSEEEPRWLTELLREGDPAAVIAELALTGRSTLCIEALDLFAAAYGAAAGNLALGFMASGGVFLGGGIAPKILAKLQEPGFLNAFTAKGRMRSMLLDIPVWVIMNPRTALLGAARHAALRLDA